jgi:hypothetical protein
MAKVEVSAIPSSTLKSYELNIHGSNPRDGDIVDISGQACGDGSAQPYRYEITGAPGATLHLVLRCPYEGCPDHVVLDEVFAIPPGANSASGTNLYFKL